MYSIFYRKTSLFFTIAYNITYEFMDFELNYSL